MRPLIHAMNDLLARLAAAIATQQRFIADAAHQLRTPIAGIKTQTELALRQSPPGRRAARRCGSCTRRPSRARGSSTSSCRSRARSRVRSRGTRSSGSTWRGSHATPRPIGCRGRSPASIDLGFDGEEGAAWIEGDPFLMREMLGNLLDNAIRYTQQGGQVTVRVVVERDAVRLSVEDNGPGIPEPERERVFERFYRVLGSGRKAAVWGSPSCARSRSHGGDRRGGRATTPAPARSAALSALTRHFLRARGLTAAAFSRSASSCCCSAHIWA